MHLKSVYASMGNLLRVLITFDSIIEQHAHLKDDWNAYKRYKVLSAQQFLGRF